MDELNGFNSKNSILVIDNSQADLQILAKMLTARGYTVQTALDSKIAFTSIQTTLPHLILLDVQMPEVNGYEICKKLKADNKTSKIPVIFISALNEVFDKVKAFAVGGIDYITKPFQTEEVLVRVKSHLQFYRVQQQLVSQNEELQATLEHLKTTQTKLVEAEKMASLGRLVSGIAHEINTPIGIGITSASYMEEETKKVANAYDNKLLKGSSLKTYFEMANISNRLILKNLDRVGELVQSFKQIAVEQDNLHKTSFVVKRYIEDTLAILRTHILKNTQHKINVSGDDNIEINNYPKALSQIVTNLVINSINHAYTTKEAGQLSFFISSKSKQLVIEYKDDGCGVSPENLAKIFDPFFTTKRSQGKTGLGLHIVYNLVTQKLKGTIDCKSKEGVGTIFTILIPVNHSLTN